MTVEDRLRRAVPPDAEDAEARAWAVVRAAAPERVTIDTATGPFVARTVVGGLAAALVALFALSGAGATTKDWVAERLEPEPARVIVAEGSTWSPNKLFMAVWKGRTLRAVEPDGDPRWKITASAPVRKAVWSPDGLRIAYIAGGRVWIVAGNGTNNRALIHGKTTSTRLRWSTTRPQELTYGTVTRDVGTGVRVR